MLQAHLFDHKCYINLAADSIVKQTVLLLQLRYFATHMTLSLYTMILKTALFKLSQYAKLLD